jgi:hypothetical protein
MIATPQSIMKRVPYVGPIISAAGLALDVREIIETATPIGAVKTITGRIVNECTPPELLIAGKCVMVIGGIIATVATGGNPMILTGTLSAVRTIIRN